MALTHLVLLMPLVLGCSTPDATAGFFVQAGAVASAADGSDCHPFSSVASALAQLPGTGGKIVVQPDVLFYALGGLTIAAPVTISGATDFLLGAYSEITPAGQLQLSNLRLTSQTGAYFGVEGTLVLDSCTLHDLQHDLALVFGSFAFLDGVVQSSAGTLVSMQAFGASVLLQNSAFSNFPLAVKFLPTTATTPDTPASIQIEDCSFTHFERAIAISVDTSVFSGTYTGVSLLTVSGSTFQDFTGVAVSGALNFWKLTLGQSKFQRGFVGLQLGFPDASQTHQVSASQFTDLGHGFNVTTLTKSLSFAGCSFTRTNQSLLLTQASPSSQLTVSDCTYEDIGNSTSTGSAFFIQNGGKVTLQRTTVKNSQAKSGAALSAYYTVLVVVTDSLWANLTATNGPGLDMQYSAVRLQSSVLDSAWTHGNAFSTSGQSTNYTQMTIRNVHADGLMMSALETITRIENTLIDSSSTGNIFMNLATSTTACVVSGTEFRNITFKLALVQNYAAQIYYFDSTIFNAAGGSGTLFANYGTFLSVTNCTFLGRMTMVVGGVGPTGFSQLSNCTFVNLTVQSLFGPGSAILKLFDSTFTDVVVTNGKLNPLSTTTVTFSNITLTRFLGQFLSCKQASLVISLLFVYNSTVPEGFNFLDMVQTSTTLTSAFFQTIHLGDSASVFRLDLQSSISLKTCHFQAIDIVSATGIIVTKQSTILLDQTTATLLNSTFIEATESRLTMTNSTCTHIRSPNPQFDGGVVRAVQMVEVRLSFCDFRDIEARNGGALYVAYTNPNKASIRRQMDPAGYVVVTDCVFDSCQSTRDGAGVYMAYTTATFAQLAFTNNSAGGSGGAVALYCNPTELQFTCFYYINETEFINNTAAAGGGAIIYNQIKPVLTNFTNVNNVAQYGAFLAAFPVEMRFMLQTKANITGESGSRLAEPITLGLYDELGQLVVSDSQSKGSLRALQTTALVAGLQTVPAREGKYTFSELSVTEDPGSTIDLQVSSDTIDYANPNPNTNILSRRLDIKLLLRSCVPGEIISNSVCDLCVAGTYSFDTSDTLCKNCPSGLTCHSGANTTVARDYWRPSNTSELLLECYAKDICLGGNLADCDTGYEGRLCTFCSSGYFRFGTFFCLPCGDTAWGVSRGIIVLLGTALFLIIMILGNLRNTAKKKSAMSIHLRILLNFLQVSMLMSSLQVKWPVDLMSFFEGLKLAGNASQFAFSNECITGDSSIRYLYQKVIVVALTPAFLIVLSLFVWGIVAIIRRKTEYLRVHAICSVIVLLLTMQPIVLQAALQLYPCVEVEPGSLWLLHDMHIACWETEHRNYAFGVALPAIIVWTVAVPVIFFALVFRQRKNLHDNVNIRRIGFLYAGYHPHFFYWEFVVVLRKSLMVMIANLMLTEQSIIQAEMAIGVVWVFTILQYREMPFETRRFNRTESLSLSTSLVTVITGALYLTDLRTQPGAYYCLLVIAFAINAFFLATWLFLFLVYIPHGASSKVVALGKWFDKLLASRKGHDDSEEE